jgi:hypothetical protein
MISNSLAWLFFPVEAIVLGSIYISTSNSVYSDICLYVLIIWCLVTMWFTVYKSTHAQRLRSIPWVYGDPPLLPHPHITYTISILAASVALGLRPQTASQMTITIPIWFMLLYDVYILGVMAVFRYQGRLPA